MSSTSVSSSLLHDSGGPLTCGCHTSQSARGRCCFESCMQFCCVRAPFWDVISLLYHAALKGTAVLLFGFHSSSAETLLCNSVSSALTADWSGATSGRHSTTLSRFPQSQQIQCGLWSLLTNAVTKSPRFRPSGPRHNLALPPEMLIEIFITQRWFEFTEHWPEWRKPTGFLSADLRAVAALVRLPLSGQRTCK